MMPKINTSFSRLVFILILLFQLNSKLGAQLLTGFSAKWDNSLKEWTIYTSDDHLEGELQTRWIIEEDWTDWSVRLGNLDARIKMRWKENPNEWELRSRDMVVSARTQFNNDFREWRITGPQQPINIKTRFRNTADEWETSSDLGTFYLRTAYQGDPRDWYIEDNMEDVALEVKIMMVFLALYSSSLPH